MYVSSKDYYSKSKELDLSDHNVPHNYIVFQPELSTYTLFRNEVFSYFDYTLEMSQFHIKSQIIYH